MNSGYSICYNEWALDVDIKNELGLLLIISSLCAENGVCWASNEYFSNMFDTTEVSISRKISKLQKKGYINIQYEKRGCEVKNRQIRLTKMLTDDYQNCKPTVNKNVKENIISINNIKENTLSKDNVKRKEFIPPSFAEVEMYITEKGYNVDPIKFYEYFSVSGWVDSRGNKVKNWKQKIITWNNSSSNNTNNKREEIVYKALN